MIHYHVANIRPDAVAATGVIVPYPIQYGPEEIARRVNANFVTASRPEGEAVDPGPAPEEVAMMAKRLAVAMNAGAKPARGTDYRVIQAANLMRTGQPFKIHSAGRSIQVAAGGPSIASSGAGVVTQPGSSVVATQVAQGNQQQPGMIATMSSGQSPTPDTTAANPLGLASPGTAGRVATIRRR